LFAVQITRNGDIVAEPGSHVATDPVKDAVHALFDEYTPSVFRNELPPRLPPEREIDHLIRMKKDVKPFTGASYRLSPLKALEKEIKSPLAKGLIEHSSAEWGAPVFFVTKKVPHRSPRKQLRMVVDFRRHNAQTKSSPHNA
jgi:hypothetical protein